jgi:hypothetical protein
MRSPFRVKNSRISSAVPISSKALTTLHRQFKIRSPTDILPRVIGLGSWNIYVPMNQKKMRGTSSERALDPNGAMRRFSFRHFLGLEYKSRHCNAAMWVCRRSRADDPFSSADDSQTITRRKAGIEDWQVSIGFWP